MFKSVMEIEIKVRLTMLFLILAMLVGYSTAQEPTPLPLPEPDPISTPGAPVISCDCKRLVADMDCLSFGINGISSAIADIKAEIDAIEAEIKLHQMRADIALMQGNLATAADEIDKIIRCLERRAPLDAEKKELEDRKVKLQAEYDDLFRQWLLCGCLG